MIKLKKKKSYNSIVVKQTISPCKHSPCLYISVQYMLTNMEKH